MSGFHHSVCGCFSDVAQCCDTYWCPCCQMGRQCDAIAGQPHSCGCGMCIVAYCFPSCFPTCIRCKVSDKFQLGENCCVSLICGHFCYACSLCQTGRELNFRGVNPGGCICVAPDNAGVMDAQGRMVENTGANAAVLEQNRQNQGQQQVSMGKPNQPPQGPPQGSPQYYQPQAQSSPMGVPQNNNNSAYPPANNNGGYPSTNNNSYAQKSP